MTACGPTTGDSDAETAATSTGDARTTGTEVPTSTGDATTGDATTATTGDATTGDATTGEPVCIEFHTTNPDEVPETPLSCFQSDVCPGDMALIFSPNGDGWTVNDLERARCVAAALRDRKLGRVEFGYQLSLGDDVRTIEILGEAAILRSQYQQDFEFEYSERLTALRPPEFFADCAGSTAIKLHDCLEDAVTDACGGPLMCP